MKRPQSRNTNSDPKIFNLDPGIHPDRWEALVGAIMERAGPILAARRQQTLAGTLSGLHRPVLAGSVGLAAAAVAVLILLPGGDATSAEVSLAEVVMPRSVAAWIDGGDAPTAIELVDAVAEYVP